MNHKCQNNNGANGLLIVLVIYILLAILINANYGI